MSDPWPDVVARVVPAFARYRWTMDSWGEPIGRSAKPPATWDVYDGGHHRVHGTVTLEREPVARRVRLFDQRDGRLLRETWSGADGTYAFIHINADRDFVVLAHDHRRQYNAVIADAVCAEPMP